MRGVLHVHSVFSDGAESLERIAQTFSDTGMDFMVVSDHAEVFDEETMRRYVALCDGLSSSRFLVIPGLEFALKGGTIHILGYGIQKRVYASNMEQLVDGIHEAGGLAVLAHPPEGSINLIDGIKKKLDGVEVWNVRYDGVSVPRATSFQLLRRVRKFNSKAAAYCGVDLHDIQQARQPVYLMVEADGLEKHTILNALRTGSFKLHGSNMTIASDGNLPVIQQLVIAVKQPLCRPWTG